ncbi:hypothetical protein [Streptomyces sp. DT171]|uniref:hypothetical protein n=1 Tax=Streptomyces sp. DT171 TaxID=3416524 RepID=UPI003CF61DA4
MRLPRPGSPEDLLRSTAETIARRSAMEKNAASALRSVIDMIDNDEAELALDDLAHVIECFRIPVLRTEYDQLAALEPLLDSTGALLESGVARFVME